MHFSTRNLFAAILFLGLFAMTLRPIADPDFWWHLRTGQLITETGAPPLTDPFSFTLPGKSWIAHEWLTEIVLYALFRVGGFGLLIIVFSLLITASYLLIYLRSPGRPYGAGFAVLLAALASAPIWGVRPQILTLLFMAVFIFFLDIYRETRTWFTLIPLPFLVILWVNLHAGYFLGFAVIGLYITGEAIELIKSYTRKDKLAFQSILNLSIVMVVCLFSALINPNTYRILTYPLETLTSNSMMQFIEEWFSPDFHQREWFPLAILILSLIAIPTIARRPVPIYRILLVCFFGFAALRSMRNVPLFALTAIPVLGEQLTGLTNHKSQTQKSPSYKNCINFFLITIVILAVCFRSIFIIQEQSESEAKNFPYGAANWILENHPNGNLYNTYGWGGYLIWRLYPEYRVFIDGRADVYGDEFIYSYLRIYAGQPGWESMLDRDGVTIVLIEPGSGLANALKNSPNWIICYEDKLSILFIKQ
jgi:hypothetical protein